VLIRSRGTIGALIVIGAGVAYVAASIDRYPGAPVDRTDLAMLWGAGSSRTGPCVNSQLKCQFCYTCQGGGGNGCANGEPMKACTGGTDGVSGAQDNCGPNTSCICGALQPNCDDSNSTSCNLGTTFCVAVTQGCETRGGACTCSAVLNPGTKSGTTSTCTSP
jgi:hypothetical protein